MKDFPSKDPGERAENIVTIKSGAHRYSELVINPEKAVKLNLEKKKYANICFGSQKHYVNIKINDDIPQDNIMLSLRLMGELHLPEYPIYEIRTEKNDIVIGPYIGLLVTEEDENLTISRLKKMMVYVREYSKLHGAIVVFALNKVDTANRLIEGYCYNPARNSWLRGKFPYPASIYRTIGLGERWKNHFLSVIGDKIFNNRYFSKWEMYQWFSGDTEKKAHIPYTILYKSYQDIIDLLEKYGKIYVKPVSGLQGREIVQASMINDTFVFRYREKGTNYTVELKNSSEAIEFIQNRFYQRKYLIQQAIDLLEYKGRIVDFRCVVQKNQSGVWVCKAAIGRCGDKDSIVSNISSGGTALPAIDMLRRLFTSTGDDIFALQEKIESFAVEVCSALDEYGLNCGNLGVDVGIDTNGRLWLIEINNRDPDPSIALDINDTELYYTFKTGQLFYAKSLAGFSSPIV